MRNKSFTCGFVRFFALFLILSLMLGSAVTGYAADSYKASATNILLTENCTAVLDGTDLVVTDTDDNNDVWSSKLLMDSGMELTPGEQYKLSFELSGENGVGEFFVCRSENIDDRYDETFTSQEGNKSITFTADGSRVYFGMQVGNLGKGNSVTAGISDLCPLSESEFPSLLRTENCTVSLRDGVITVTDTGENNDVWNSKILYDAGVALEIGKTYTLEISLSGDNGAGEFFVCRSQDLNDRYDSTFVNTPGQRSVTFTAESDRLYIGMQFGNLGKGNSLTAVIGETSETTPATAPGGGNGAAEDAVAVNCSYSVSGNTITVTDEGSNDNDVWDSKLVYDAGITLEPGKKYAIRITLSGDNGVGEFFLCKSKNPDDRYDGTFYNLSGERVMVFTAEDTTAYIGMQMGNVGEGNSVQLTVEEVTEYDEAARKTPKITQAHNCTYQVSSSGSRTEIQAEDTDDSNNVWDSTLLYYLGEILEAGRFYGANLNLSGENGVGEFFFCKSNDLGDRYDETFCNTVGDHSVQFAAEGSELYAGMQFGNIGNGNIVSMLFDLFRIPGLRQGNANACSESFGQDAITLTDTDGAEGGVWTSSAVYDTGFELEPGKTYTATFTLSGDNGVGEFFFLQSADIGNVDHRYCFQNAAGNYTITFTAQSAELYFGMQCGNLGEGNSVTVSNISVTPVESEDNMLGRSLTADPAPETDPSEDAEGQEDPAPAEEPVPAEDPAPAEEPVPAEDPAPPAEDPAPAEETA